MMHTPISILSMIIMLKDNHTGTKDKEYYTYVNVRISYWLILLKFKLILRVC
jgi:hypothetical protein